MKHLIASMVLLPVMFTTDLPLMGTTTAFAAGKVSSSYRYLKGIGKLNYKKSFDDAARAIVLNDFNGDGYTDVGYAGGRHWMSDRGQKHETHRLEIFLNNRTGRLKASGKKMFIGRAFTHKDGEPLTVTVAWDVKTNGKSTLADITGDGRPDWLVPSSYNTSTPQRISIIQGKGKKLKVGPGKTPLSVFHHQSLADIDGDGDLDLIVSLSYTHIFNNPGNGKFSCKEYLGPPYYTKKRCWNPISTAKLGHSGYGYANLVIDLDGDNLPEIVTANYNGVTSDLADPNPHLSGRVYVWKNLDGKNFKLKQTIAGPGKWKDTKGKKYSVGAAGSKAVDIDGDGDLDGLFYYECGDWCSGTNPIMVLKNLGNGKVKRWQIINASPAKGSYVGSTNNKLLGAPQIIDLNGDKRPDLVFNYADNYNGSMKHAHKQIWINKGNGKFKRLTTKIFAKVSGNSKKGKIVALHANKDKKIDWLVIWDDGTYATLIARGGSLLPAAYSRLAEQLSNNAQLLSFNQMQMTDLVNLNSDSAITLGFQADSDGSIHHAAYGFRYGDTHVSFMMNSGLLGLHPAGSLHVQSPKTRYAGIRHQKTLGDWTTDSQITYGYAQGKGSADYVQDVKDIHALGFSLATRYRLNPDQQALFSVSQPMRIVRGGLVFDGVVDDLVPDGRQTDLTLGFNYQLNQDSAIKTAFTYTTDRNHYQGERNSQIMLTYSGKF